MDQLFNDVAEKLIITEFNRVCINDNIDIYFNNIELFCRVIILLLDDDFVARLELKKFNYKICCDTIYIYIYIFSWY